MECEINISNRTCTAVMSGQFVFSDHIVFKDILGSAESPDVQQLVLDLSQIDFIDSAGLGMLLLLRDVCEKHKKLLTLRNPQGQVKKVFGISKFEHLFKIEP